MDYNFIVVLTVYKRKHLENQLKSVYSQTIKPKHVVVFQNENHINIDILKGKYDFLHVKNEYNTKYIGRFLYCLNFNVDYFIIMDDDIIPGRNCFKNYLDQSNEYNAIIGGNGRLGYYTKLSKNLKDVGIRPKTELVDFVGHLWCVKQEHIRTMASLKPYTLDTSEDMHLCYSNKVINSVNSFLGKQSCPDDMCDISMNSLANDQFSSFKTTPKELRMAVEKYFIDNYNLKLIDH